MPIHLYLAPPGGGKTAYLIRRATQVARGLAGEPRVLVATRLQARAWQRRLAETGGALGVRVGTFDDLYREILGVTGGAYTLLSRPVQQRLLRTLIAHSDLRHYASLRNAPGFAEIVLDLIAELKAGGVFPDPLAEAIRALGDEPRLAELASLYEGYQASLQAHGWTDYAGLGWLAAEALEQHPEAAQGWPALLLDGFDDLTSVQRRVLRLLAGRVRETLIALTGGPGGQAPRIVHRRAARTRAALEADLGVVAEPLPVAPVSERAAALAYLERTFLGGESTREPADGAISLLAATDRAGEVRAALRWLKARVVQDGLRLNQAALLARQLEPYRAMIAATAAEFGLPVHIVEGLPLAANPAVAALLDLLRLTLPDQLAFPWRLTVEAWRSPYLDWEHLGILREDAEALARVARWGNVLGGLEAWRETFAILVAAPEQEDVENGLEEEGLPPGSAPHGPAAQALWNKFEAFVEQVTPPEGAQPCRIFVAWIEALIGPGEPDEGDHDGDDLGLARRALQGSPDLRERDWAALQALKDVLRGMVWADEALACAPAPYGVFAADLLGAVEAARYRLPLRADADALLVADANQTRGLRFAAVALLGLAEGEFPTTLTEDPLLRDADRLRLRTRFGLAIDPSAESAEAEYGYEALTRADRALLLTRPRIADNGAPWQASPYWEEVLRRVETTPVELGAQELPPLAEAASWPEVLLGVAARRDPAAWAWVKALAPERATALARAAQVLQERHGAMEQMTLFDGNLAVAGAYLTQRFGPDHSWSIGRLESYSVCPLMFFFTHVLGLEQRQPPREGLDARQLGTLYHRILARLYTSVTDPSNLQELLETLPSAAQEVLDEAPQREQFRPTRWWSHTRGEIIERLQASLVALDASAGGYVPYVHEWTFGMRGRAPLELPDGQGQRLRLRGIVDRIDQAPDGSLRVIDYKTAGKTGYTPAAVQSGEKLQLPLYARAVEEALQGPVAEGFYWHVGQAERSTLSLSRYPGGPSAAMQTAIEHAWRAARGARAGHFAPAPPQNGCPTYCPGAAFCWRRRAGWGEPS